MKQLQEKDSTSSAIWTHLCVHKGIVLKGHPLSQPQVNKLVATINCRLTPAQQAEVKGFFVFGEPPSRSTRDAFEKAALTITQNPLVLDMVIA
jgi:hypothetical protein